MHYIKPYTITILDIIFKYKFEKFVSEFIFPSRYLK